MRCVSVGDSDSGIVGADSGGIGCEQPQFV